MSEQLPDFEKAMAELEALVNKLEAGDLPLAKALEDFEKGVMLVRQCQTHLDHAKAQVDKLMAVNGQEPSQSGETSD